MKICNGCKEEFLLTKEFFYRNCSKKSGFNSRCKKCTKKYNREYGQNNKEKISQNKKEYYQNNKGEIAEARKEYSQNNKEKIKEYQHKYSQENKEKIKECQHKYYQENREKRIKLMREYDRRNREKRKEYDRENRERRNELAAIRRAESHQMRVSTNISRGIRFSLKGRKKGHAWEVLTGYTLEELMPHLESQFQEGMTWENYGLYGWHIDHIRPISSFNFESYEDEDFKKCWALENLQPLWAKDNLEKHTRWDPEDG